MELKKEANTMYCTLCMSDQPIDIRIENESYRVKGTEVEIIAQVTYCQRCQTQIWNNKIDDHNLTLAYTKYQQMLSDEQL